MQVRNKKTCINIMIEKIFTCDCYLAFQGCEKCCCITMANESARFTRKLPHGLSEFYESRLAIIRKCSQWAYGLDGYDVAFTRRRSPVQIWISPFIFIFIPIILNNENQGLFRFRMRKRSVSYVNLDKHHRRPFICFQLMTGSTSS